MIEAATKRAPRRKDIPRMREVMADTHPDHNDAEAREIQDGIRELRAGREQDERQIESIRLDDLKRHPLNRIIIPTDESIQSLAESIKTNGQLEPLRVRKLGVHSYQIVSGERRWTALQVAGIAMARCVVVNIDDATALREVAAANGNRQDLNPIQRAQLMQELMQPKDKGGSDLSLVEAGALFGLNSESGCKNAVRILRLPEPIQQQLIEGKLPERYARALIPYANAEPLMQEVIKDLQDDGYARGELMAAFEAEDLASWMISTLNTKARPISEDLEYWHQWPINIRTKCLFDWKAHESKLQIIEVLTDLGHDHKTKRSRVEPRQWALNTKLWDKLQEPLAKKAAEEGKRQPSRTKDTNSKAKPEKKLSPKEQAALDRKRAIKADKRLDTFTRDWLCRLIRCTLASLSNDDALVCVTLPWIIAQCGQSELRVAHEQALLECQVTTKRTRDVLTLLPKAKANDSYNVLCALWRVLLWPVTRLIGEASKQSELTPAGTLPDRLISFGYQGELKNLQYLLALTKKVSVETAWQAGTVDDSDERRLISVWLCRHTKAQLHKLCTELSISPGVNMNRDELAGHVLSHHRSGKPLKLPKRLSGAK